MKNNKQNNARTDVAYAETFEESENGTIISKEEEVVLHPFLLEVGKTYRGTHEDRPITFNIWNMNPADDQKDWGGLVGQLTQFTVVEFKPRNEFNTFIRVCGLSQEGQEIEAWTVWFHHMTHHEIEASQNN